MNNLFSLLYYLSLIFSIWMGIDCIKRKDNVFMWLFAIFIFHPLGALYYLFKVRNFQLPLLHMPHFPAGEIIAESSELHQLKEQVKTIGGSHQYEQLGMYYLKERQFRSARVSLSRALEKNPQSLSVRYGLGKSLFSQEKFMEAAEILEGLVREESNYDYGYALFGLAECYRMAGENDKALVVYERVYNQSSFFKASIRYAELLEKNRDIDKAKEIMQSVIARSKTLPEYKYDKEVIWIKEAERFIEKYS